MASKSASKSTLSSSAQRLLARLGLGRDPVQSADTEDAGVLVAADLAARRSDGRVVITVAGRAHLARIQLQASDAAIDPFLGQHLALERADIDDGTGRVSVAVDAAESPLVWLARRKGRDGRPLIEPVQLLAGERLREDFTRAQMMPRMTANWSAPLTQIGRRDGGGAAHVSDVIVASRQRVRHALDAVGPEFAGLLLDVCCFLRRLDDLERERGWPARSAKIVLQLGLDRLARHYGLETEIRGTRAGVRANIRIWLAEDAVFEDV